jgi:hypothetical protein
MVTACAVPKANIEEIEATNAAVLMFLRIEQNPTGYELIELEEQFLCQREERSRINVHES